MAILNPVVRAIQKTASACGLLIARQPHLRSPYVCEYHHGEHSFRYWITSDTAQSWYATLSPDTHELRELKALLPRRGRVLELGTHHGIHALWMITHPHYDLHYHGIEADPANAVTAHAQIGLNDLCARMSVQNLIISDQLGAEWISRRDNHVENHPFSDATMIPASTIDAITSSGPDYDLLKIDIEGYELKALRGGTALLSNRPALAVEVHFHLLRHLGDPHEELFALIDDLGYRGRILSPDGRVQPFRRQMWKETAASFEKANLFLKAS